MTEAGMNMDRFNATAEKAQQSSGAEFADITRLVVGQGVSVRLVGDLRSNWEHFVNMPAGPRPYNCDGPESDCPICRAVAQLASSDDPDQQEIGKNARAKEKYYFNCLDRSPAGKQLHSVNKKTHLLTQNAKGNSIGKQLFLAIASVVQMRTTQGQPSDPNCYDLIMTKSGTGLNTKYGAQFSGETTPLTDEEKGYEQWPLDQITKISSLTDRQIAADLLLGRAPAAATTAPAQAQSVNTQQYSAQSPVSKPAAAPPPAKPPQNDPPFEPDNKPKTTLTPQAQLVSLQDATPGRQVDMSTHMEVPCANCNSTMLFSMKDGRDFKCASCGTLYNHPGVS